MNKVYGTLNDFALIKEDASRIIVSYELTPVDYDPEEEVAEQSAEEGEGEEPEPEPEPEPVKHATWFEVYFYKKQVQKPTLKQVKDAVFADIDSQTDEKILTGYVWRVPKVGGEPEEVSVWLSSENQFNYKAAFDLAFQTEGQSLPVVFKFGETEEPVYHTFSEFNELKDFYTGAVTYINNTLAEGWQRKDTIDWSVYDAILNPPEPEPEPEPEPLVDEETQEGDVEPKSDAEE